MSLSSKDSVESASKSNQHFFENKLNDESSYLGRKTTASPSKDNIFSRIKEWVIGLFYTKDKISATINPNKISIEKSEKDLSFHLVYIPETRISEIDVKELKILSDGIENAIIDNNYKFLFEKIEFICSLDDGNQEYKILKEKSLDCLIGFFKSEMQLSDFKSLELIENALFSYIKELKDERKDETIQILGYLSSYSATPKNFKTAIMTLPQKIAQTEGGSRAARQTYRTPSEVVVHLLSYLDAHKNEKKHLQEFNKICRISKHNFLRHQLSLNDTKNLFKKVNDLCKGIDELNDLSDLCKKLNNQLPNSSKHLFDTRLQDSIYTRAFDSSLIEDLVNNPSEGIKFASEAAGKSFANWFQQLKGVSRGSDINYGNEICLEAIGNLKNILVQSPRFWVSQVPDLVRLQNSSTPEEAEEALLSFFNSPKSTGFDCIAMQFIIAKFSMSFDTVIKKRIPKEKLNFLSNHEKDRLIVPFVPWLAKANPNYAGEIGAETSRIIGDRTKLTKGSGITLAYQPLITEQEDWMVSNQRPTTVNRPNLEKQSQSTRLALQNALPWGSGVSGTTNILLHYLSFCQLNQAIDSKDFLLNVMMFIVYDGGHSMHEALWIANQLDKTLDLNLKLNPNKKKNSQFISDYENLLKIFHGNESGQKLESAYETAFEKMYQYFNQNSYYADMV